MSWGYRAFLKRSANDVTPEQVQAFLLGHCNLPPSALSNLRVTSAQPGFHCYYLTHRTSHRRPHFWRWESQDMATEVIREVIEDLGTGLPPHVRDFLEGCVDMVTAAFEPDDDVGELLGRSVCMWLARTFDGIIRDPNLEWKSPDRNPF